MELIKAEAQKVSQIGTLTYNNYIYNRVEWKYTY